MWRVGKVGEEVCRRIKIRRIPAASGQHYPIQQENSIKTYLKLSMIHSTRKGKPTSSIYLASLVMARNFALRIVSDVLL